MKTYLKFKKSELNIRLIGATIGALASYFLVLTIMIAELQDFLYRLSLVSLAVSMDKLIDVKTSFKGLTFVLSSNRNIEITTSLGYILIVLAVFTVILIIANITLLISIKKGE